MEELIPRHQLGWGRECLGAFPAVVIQGARQVGKSTFARMLLEDRPHVAVTLDDEMTRAAAREDPRAFADQAGDGTLIIDEIQRDPQILLAIKASIDRNRTPGRFVLTGSSDLLRLSRTPDSLAGRAVTIDLYGLSQGELARTRDDFGAWVHEQEGAMNGGASSWDRTDYASVLARGGYPDAIGHGSKLRAAWFDSYLERLLRRDVGDVSRGLSSDRLRSVLALVAANQGGELVQARLADALAIPTSSISAYVSALNTLYLTHDLPPWRTNLTRREIGRHKLSIADSGLAMRLAGLQPTHLSSLTAAPVLGAQLEAFVAAELAKQRGWSEAEYRLFHFRDRDGLEVDLVLEFEDGRVFLIEVKATTTYRGEHIRPIRTLAERLGDRFIGGAVLGLAPERVQLADRVWGIPITALWQR
ncbi:MAG: ATP-binding protein [Leucobacter sp.]